MDTVTEVREIPCQCEASKNGDCKAVLRIENEGGFFHILIQAPHISKDQYGGQLGVYIKQDILSAIKEDSQ